MKFRFNSIRTKIMLSIIIIVVVIQTASFILDYNQTKLNVYSSFEQEAYLSTITYYPKAIEAIEEFEFFDDKTGFIEDYMHLKEETSFPSLIEHSTDLEEIFFFNHARRFITQENEDKIDRVKLRDLFFYNKIVSREINNKIYVFVPLVNGVDYHGGSLFVFSNKGIAERVNSDAFNLLVSLIIFIAMAAALSLLLSDRITRQLKELITYSKEISKGDLDHEIKITSKDEIGSLFYFFNSMRIALKKNQEKLEEANKNLEVKIKKRTSDLLRINKELQLARVYLLDEKKNVEKKIKARTRELKKEKKKVSSILNIKTNFLNQVAHDLRTPLTPIKLLVDSLLKAKLETKVRSKIEIISKNVESLQYLITEVLSLARLDSSKNKLHAKKYDVNVLLNEIIDTNMPVFNNQKIEVSRDLLKRQTHINVDKNKIIEVVGNIISNSIKYMGDGNKKIAFKAKELKDKVKITITDTGKGIKNENVGRVFEEFFKEDQYQGGASTGLGLAICKKIIELHDGDIWAESKGVGKGTSIIITMPKYGSLKNG